MYCIEWKNIIDKSSIYICLGRYPSLSHTTLMYMATNTEWPRSQGLREKAEKHSSTVETVETLISTHRHPADKAAEEICREAL